MDFRAAARRTASDALSPDLSMDPTMQDAKDPHDPGQPAPGSTEVHSDGADPASPGGPAPYNGIDPVGEPVADDPLWRDQSEPDENRGGPMPHVDGPDEDKTTLHNARRHMMAASSPWNCKVGDCGKPASHYAWTAGDFIKPGESHLCPDHAQQLKQFSGLFQNNNPLRIDRHSQYRDDEPDTLHNARLASYAAKAYRYGSR